MLTKYIDAQIEYAEAEKEICPNGMCSIVKTASERPEIFNDIKIKKNHAYLYVIAMGAGDFYGENKNGDFFWEKDLKQYYTKFLTSGVFVQHDNKDPSKSIGKVLKAIYNDEMHRVELLIEIKKELAPDIYYSIENGERIAVSMGTKVTEEHCSYCGHVTKDSLANRCEHLKYMMHQIMPNGVRVFAINHPPLNFFDISIVRRPADTQGYALFQKVASDNSERLRPRKKALSKIAELKKRIDAWAVSNPLNYSDIKEIKQIPMPILSNFIKANDILLRPSEIIGLLSNIDEHTYSSITKHDTLETMLKLLSLLEGYGQQHIAPVIKIASEDRYPVLNKLKHREILVKEAINQMESENIDAFGNKRIKITKRHKTTSYPYNEYAGIRINLNNGDSVTVQEHIFDDVFEAFKDSGAIDSVYGILPNGTEKIISVQR